MYAFPAGRRVVRFCDSSSDDEDSKKKCKRKSKKDKRNNQAGGVLLYPSGPVPLRFPPGVAPIYVPPPPPRPIFAAHIQVSQPVVPPCPMIAVTHTQLYPRPAFGPMPSTTYVLQAVNQTHSAVPVAGTGAYTAVQSPVLYPIYTG